MNKMANKFSTFGLIAMGKRGLIMAIFTFLLLAGGITQGWAATEVGSNLKLYKPSKANNQPVVLLFSPKTGWSQETETVARQFNQLGYGVVGLNGRSFMTGGDGHNTANSAPSCSRLRDQATAVAQQFGQRWQQPAADPPSWRVWVRVPIWRISCYAPRPPASCRGRWFELLPQFAPKPQPLLRERSQARWQSAIHGW
jgi:hypothetical protein